MAKNRLILGDHWEGVLKVYWKKNRDNVKTEV
jgi:hypothetical protein